LKINYLDFNESYSMNLLVPEVIK